MSWHSIERVMDVFEDFGEGQFAIGLAVVMIAYGFLAKDRRIRQVGFAALLAVVAVGFLADLLKFAFQTPRPRLGQGTYGFPSGHASVAFALAGVLGHTFPASAPFLFLFALLAGFARLYYRAHFMMDVIAGGVLGTAGGLGIARILLGPRGTERKSRVRWVGWALSVAIGLPILAFFMAYERATEAHQSASGHPANFTPHISVKFGTPDARALLVEGWSGDGTWKDKFPVVWAKGESTLRLPALAPMDHRIRVKLEPFVDHKGPTCLVMETALDGVPIARFLVEKGWREHEIRLSKDLIKPGPNEIRFRFAYAGAPASHGRDATAAFRWLEIFEDGARRGRDISEPRGEGGSTRGK